MRFMYLTTDFPGNRTVLRGMCRVKGHASDVFFESASRTTGLSSLFIGFFAPFTSSPQVVRDRTVGVSISLAGSNYPTFAKSSNHQRPPHCERYESCSRFHQRAWQSPDQ